MIPEILLISISLLNVVTSITVTTTHGNVEGRTIDLFSGKNVDAFLGIPYAEAPIGKHRFSSPQPLAPWKGTLQAKSLPRPCYQGANDYLKKTVSFVSEAPETEDCLYLNLWVPQNSSTSNEKKPIMIWVLPGGYFAGSTGLPMYNGSILASEQDVIVVSMNYRISIFGFMFLNSSQVPGNMGLQDQIQAITWIKDNAEAFGGDPGRITLFGESVGSISVGFHLTNMNIYNLFRNGIMESGPVDLGTLSNTKEKALEKDIAVVKSLNCPTMNENEMLSCLRSKTPQEILKGHLTVPKYLNLEFVPVRNGIEVPLFPSSAAEEIPPEKRKNLISGNIPREILFFNDVFDNGKELSDDLVVDEAQVDTVLVDLFNLTDKRLQEIVLFNLRDFDRPFNRSQLRLEFGKLITDPTFNCPQRKFTKTWATGTNNVYHYSFQHRPSKPIKVAFPEWAGALHSDDIPFVFGLPLNDENGYTDVEKVISRNVMNLWGNFAKTGNPNGINNPNEIWPKIDPNGNFTTLVIDEHIRTENYFSEESCTFWEEVYPELLKIQDDLKKK